MRSKVKKRLLFIVPAGVVVLALSGWLIWRHYHNATNQKANPPSQTSKINSVNNSPPITEQNNSGQNTKPTNNGSNPSPAVGGITPNSQPGTISISRVGQPEALGVISLRTIITGLTAGRCTAVFSLEGQESFQLEANVVPSATYYTCDIDVPANSFNVTGYWNVSVMVHNAQGSIVSNTATSDKPFLVNK